jgi:hypothetical protein
MKQIIVVMEFTAVVLHRGARAYYAVSERGRDRFVASLVAYKGDPASSPPTQVSLEKQGRHCTGNVEDIALLDELYYAAKEKLNNQP